MPDPFYFFGFGGQWHIEAKDYDIASAVNIRHKDDFVPLLSLGNRSKQYNRVIIQESNNPHKFMPGYYPPPR